MYIVSVKEFVKLCGKEVFKFIFYNRVKNVKELSIGISQKIIDKSKKLLPSYNDIIKKSQKKLKIRKSKKIVTNLVVYISKYVCPSVNSLPFKCISSQPLCFISIYLLFYLVIYIFVLSHFDLFIIIIVFILFIHVLFICSCLFIYLYICVVLFINYFIYALFIYFSINLFSYICVYSLFHIFNYNFKSINEIHSQYGSYHKFLKYRKKSKTCRAWIPWFWSRTSELGKRFEHKYNPFKEGGLKMVCLLLVVRRDSVKRILKGRMIGFRPRLHYTYLFCMSKLLNLYNNSAHLASLSVKHQLSKFLKIVLFILFIQYMLFIHFKCVNGALRQRLNVKQQGTEAIAEVEMSLYDSIYFSNGIL